MKTTYTLFTEVSLFYATLSRALNQAQTQISMMYYTFDYGYWSNQIFQILQEKAANGVRVRLMIDEFGLIADTPTNALRNQTLLKRLQAAGIEVSIFRPKGPRLSQFNRLHCKMCAIDHNIAFVGGSNIGDHYPDMRDTNLRLEGDLGQTFHQLYDFVGQFSQSRAINSRQSPLRLSELPQLEDTSILLTLPGHRQDIRRALLELILSARQAIYISAWYFLPDREILNALLSQAEAGVKVYILLSHRTRVPVVDAANYIAGHKLSKAGAQVFRYTDCYMHAKVAWNDGGDIILGSANMDEKSLSSNFECCLQIHNQNLAQALQRAFEADQRYCQLQTRKTLRRWSWPRQAVSYACSYAGAWL
jgi:cardiolipin synthase